MLGKIGTGPYGFLAPGFSAPGFSASGRGACVALASGVQECGGVGHDLLDHLACRAEGGGLGAEP
ncbi:hypothetical protein GCM10027161_05350 [Microbispora hainanensis]